MAATLRVGSAWFGINNYASSRVPSALWHRHQLGWQKYTHTYVWQHLYFGIFAITFINYVYP